VIHVDVGVFVDGDEGVAGGFAVGLTFCGGKKAKLLVDEGFFGGRVFAGKAGGKLPEDGSEGVEAVLVDGVVVEGVVVGEEPGVVGPAAVEDAADGLPVGVEGEGVEEVFVFEGGVVGVEGGEGGDKGGRMKDEG
jgi:hypothetical protein